MGSGLAFLGKGLLRFYAIIAKTPDEILSLIPKSVGFHNVKP